MAIQLRQLVYAEGVNPISWSLVMPLCVLILFDAMTFTVVFSYLPKLVKSFGISEVDTGYNVGIIGSTLFIGRIFFSFLWGYLADNYGRKRILLVSATTLALVNFAFGFSNSVIWAALTRLGQGITMGVIVIGKAMMVEACDDTNSSLGMSFILAAVSVGMIAGPSVGGFLAFPGELYPAVFLKESIFSHFNILLPSLIVSLGLSLGVILTILFVPKDKVSICHDVIKDCHDNVIARDLYNEKSLLLEYTKTSRSSNILIKIKRTKLGKLLSNKNCILSCVLYMFYSMIGIGFDEIYSLYAATSRKYHGFGFTTSNIGVTLVIVGLLILILQLVAVSKVVKHFGSKKCFLISCMVQFVCYPLLPLCHRIENFYFFWVMQISIVFMIRVSMFTAVLCCSLLVNNSVERADAASANGLSVTLQTIGRSISIPVLGSLYGWSLTNIKSVPENQHALGFPFNEHFLFFVLSLAVMCTGFYALLIPESLNRTLVTRGVETKS